MTQLPKSKVRSVGVSNHTIDNVRAAPPDWNPMNDTLTPPIA